MLAWLILSENISPNVLPFDPFEAQLFFNNHFKGSKSEVFQRYCQYHEQDSDKIMDYYRSISKIEKYCAADNSHRNNK